MTTRSIINVAIALALAGCGAKPDAADDFASFAGVDEKSDAFSTHLKIVGTLSTTNSSVAFPYTASPRYRALKLTARAGDLLKITVTPWSGKVKSGGDPVTWLLDASFKIVAKNDDVDASHVDSLVMTHAPRTGSYWVVVRDYNSADATFTATLQTARFTGDLTADAESAYDFYVAGDDYGLADARYAVSASELSGDAATLQAEYTANFGSSNAYAIPYNRSRVYVVTMSAEETYAADLFDAGGNFLAHGYSDGGPGVNGWSTTPPDPKNP
ncbi:MAG TPA: hypothetical protein VFF06_10460 [Polyangia bacterium]|nr:hypothetical protein [Polyangia bacterium]